VTRPLSVLTEAPLPPDFRGGIEEYAYSVVEAQREEGLTVTVLTTRFPSRAPVAPAAGTVTVPARMMLARPLVSDPRAYLRIFSMIRKSDLVHVHMPFPLVEVFTGYAAKLLGRPLIVTYQMDAVLDEPIPGQRTRRLSKLIERTYTRLSARPTLRLATQVVTSTVAYGKESPILSEAGCSALAIHQGIDRTKFQSLDPKRAQALRDRYVGGSAQKLVVFVGRFVPYKGLDYLLEAAEALRGKDIRFVLGGSGPLVEHIRERVKTKNLTNVTLIGFVADADLVNLFYAADLVVSPSISLLECTPITLLYASAVGTPVIGTTVGGTAESIPTDGVHGAVVPPRDVPALVHAIIELLDRSAKQSPSNTPRCWDNVAADYTDLMTEQARLATVSATT
jgi:glycosyltransferase involved in cell wall biosynthesis